MHNFKNNLEQILSRIKIYNKLLFDNSTSNSNLFANNKRKANTPIEIRRRKKRCREIDNKKYLLTAVYLLKYIKLEMNKIMYL